MTIVYKEATTRRTSPKSTTIDTDDIHLQQPSNFVGAYFTCQRSIQAHLMLIEVNGVNKRQVKYLACFNLK